MSKSMNAWHLTSLALKHRDAFRVVLIWGPPGVGKTYTAQHESLTSGGVVSVTLTPETPASELRGFYVPKGGEFVWQDGPVVMALRRGARLIINEISHASSDVLALLYPLLESTSTAGVPLPSGEVVKPAEGFQAVITDNHSPAQLPEALQDRADAICHITELHPDALARIAPEYREAAIQLAKPDVPFDRRVSVRGWLRLSEALRRVETEEAFALVFGPERGAMLRDALAIAGA